MLTLVALLGLAACAVGCGSDTSTPATTFTEIYDLIYPVTTRSQCNFCHSLPANQVSNGKLHMGTDRATAYAALVGQASTSDACGGHTYVVPGSPDDSLLLAKLSANPPCGGRMPLGGDALTAAQLDKVRSWIAAGANDD